MNKKRFKSIVLRRTNYGEADRIIDLLTQDGRMAVIAKGVRKEKSKLAGGIELFAICDVVIAEGKSDLGILISARIINFFGKILNNFERMQFAYEVLSHINIASNTLNTPDWYDITVEILSALDDESIPIELIQTWFYVRIAELHGEELNTIRDIEGSMLHQTKTYRYDNHEKGLAIDDKGPIRAGHIKIMRLCAQKSIVVITQVGGLREYLDLCKSIAIQHASLQKY